MIALATSRAAAAGGALLAFLLLGVAQDARAQDETGCREALRQAKGKYVSCFGKASAKGFSARSLDRCRSRYAASWPRVQTRYPGTSCAGPRFVDHGDGTVSDTLTELVWEQKDAADQSPDAQNRHDVDNQYTLATDDDHVADGTAYTDFLADLNSNAFAGQRDWRIPLLVEALTIVGTDEAPCGLTPCVAAPVLLPSSDSFWTSSSSNQDAHGFLVVLEAGYALDAPRTTLQSTRAVRGGF